MMVERCFADAEYPDVLDGENAATVGGFGSNVSARELAPLSEVWLADLDMPVCESQGVSIAPASRQFAIARMG